MYRDYLQKVISKKLLVDHTVCTVRLLPTTLIVIFHLAGCQPRPVLSQEEQ